MTETVAKYDDEPVKWFIYPAIFFMVWGMLVGLFISINGFLFPDYFSGEYVHFGRIRPVHVGSVLLLWLISANIGLSLFMVQRLCGVPLWSSFLAKAACILWWSGTILSTFSFPWGTNWGWEYAEIPPWLGYLPIRVFILMAWLLIAFNIFMTVATRVIKKMYVSLWYIMGTMIWGTITFIVGTYGLGWVPGGISKVNMSFFYVHNLVGHIFTPFGLAAAYFFLPKLANVPIYSHTLSMVGFWTIAFAYSWIGAHHIIHGPMSQWLQTTSIVFSIWLFIPVWTVVTNLYGTLQPNWNKYFQSAPIRFIIMGNTFYLLTCIQGPLMAVRNINEITSKTDWVIGHSHISLYATFTFFAIAGIYYVIPILTGKHIWSKKLTNWHFALNLFGSVPFILSLWIGGFLQGLEWSSWATGSSYAQYHNNLTVLPFLQTIADIRIWWIFRSIGGAIVLFANILFAVNIFNTVLLKEREPLLTSKDQNELVSAT